MDRVFRRHKTVEVTLAKCQKKFQGDKDLIQRLKYLRTITTVGQRNQVYRFFYENPSAVFFTVVDSFYQLMNDNKVKASPSYTKDLESVFSLFETILLHLPDLIRVRWQFNSFVEFFEELLNEKNALSIRKIGIRLFVIWYQILGDNSNWKCHNMWINLVPGFGKWIYDFAKSDARLLLRPDTRQSCSVESSVNVEKTVGINASEPGALAQTAIIDLHPVGQDAGEKLLRHFLNSLVIDGSRIIWKKYSEENSLMQFWFLFEQLKRTYLPVIFPCLSPHYSIYDPNQDRKHSVVKLPENYPIPSGQLCIFQEIVITWLSTYIDTSEKNGAFAVSEVMKNLANAKTPNTGSVVSSTTSDYSYSDGTTDTDRSRSAQQSNAIETTHGMPLSNGLEYQDRGRAYHRAKEISTVCSVLYGCRQNINLLHDILHHAFCLPIQYYPALSSVVSVYRSWIENKADRPIFLHDIGVDDTLTTQYPNRDLNSPTDDQGHEGDDESDFEDSLKASSTVTSTVTNKSLAISPSDPEFSVMGPKPTTFTEPEELRGCFQLCLRLMLQNMSRVFFLTCPPPLKTQQTDYVGNSVSRTVDFVKQQAALCRNILKIFQLAANTGELHTETWLQLMSILLNIMESTMLNTSPQGRWDDSWLSDKTLIPFLFQTMNGALLRASLAVPIGEDPWNRCLRVYSQLTHWPAVIGEWKKVMHSLTKVLAKVVYGVDLTVVEKEPRGRAVKTSPANRARPKSFHEAMSARQPSDSANSKTAGVLKTTLAQSQISAFSVGSALNELEKPPPSTLVNKTRRGIPQVSVDRTGPSPPPPEVYSQSDGGLIDSGCNPQRSGTLVADPYVNHAPDRPVKRPELVHSKHDPTLGMADLLPIPGQPERPHTSLDRATTETGDQLPRSHSIPRLSDTKVQEMGTLRTTDTSPQDLQYPLSSGRCDDGQPCSDDTSSLKGLSSDTEKHLQQESSSNPTATSPESTSDGDPNLRLSDASGTLVKSRNVSGQGTLSTRCVMAGGSVRRWTPVSVVVCWRRFLGIFGNINQISDPSALQQVYSYLAELVSSLLHIQQHQRLEPVSSQSVRPRARYCPPLEFITPILFEALTQPDKPQPIKLSALRTLCDIMLRPPDRMPNWEVLSQFYWTLHTYLSFFDESYVNEIIRSCGMRFFASELPGSHLMLMDFLYAATSVLNSQAKDVEVPRTEAITMLCTLHCFSDHFGSLECLDPSVQNGINLFTCSNLKPRLAQLLIQVVQESVSIEARCLALCALAVQCVVELIHTDSEMRRPSLTQSSFIAESIVILLGMMRFENRCVALVAVDMILMLAAHANTLLRLMPNWPKIILQSLTWTLNRLWISRQAKTVASIDKRLLAKLILAIVEWTVNVPIKVLTASSSSSDQPPEGLLVHVFKVLYSIVCNPIAPDASSTVRGAVDLDDPVISVLSDCHVPLNMDSFWTPRSPLDTSSSGLHSSLLGLDLNVSGDKLPPVCSIRLAARVALCHLLNHLDHFPQDSQNALLHTIIQEHHDQTDKLAHSSTDEDTELSLATMEQNNVQVFAINGSVLVSCLTLPGHSGSMLPKESTPARVSSAWYPRLMPIAPLVVPSGSRSSEDAPCVISDDAYCRLIIRDFSGKYSWDMSCLHGLLDTCVDMRNAPSSQMPFLSTQSPESVQPSLTKDSDETTPDPLDKLMRRLIRTSPECSVPWSSDEQVLNKIDSDSEDPCATMDALTSAQLASQTQSEEESRGVKSTYFLAPIEDDSAPVPEVDSPLTLSPLGSPPPQRDSNLHFFPESASRPPDRFLPSRRLLSQLGFLSFDRRTTIDLVQKSVGLVRDLKHLDKVGVREPHKIAIFYIGAGQEDKQSILDNQLGSVEFEHFVAGLGWEIDLTTHQGFRGGLERTGRAGVSAPYYATATLEIMFHVSTRMPSSTQGDLKYKHLGNDEVMIIWSENSRPFIRDILRTQFGDVLILIYPLPSGLFRVEVKRGPNVGFFGPIVHAAVLDANTLPSLVRATAISASRAVKMTKPGYRPYHEDRVLSLKQLIARHAVQCSFEDFAQSLVLPNVPPAESSKL